MEFGFRHAVFTKSDLEDLDRIVVRCLQHLCKIPHALNKNAVSKITGIGLPSNLLTKIKVSEAVIRLNMCSDASYTGRQRWLAMSTHNSRNKWNRFTDVVEINNRLS